MDLNLPKKSIVVRKHARGLNGSAIELCFTRRRCYLNGTDEKKLKDALKNPATADGQKTDHIVLPISSTLKKWKAPLTIIYWTDL